MDQSDPAVSFCSYDNVVTNFEWDPEKAEQNLRKRGVSFDTATEVFYDDRRLEIEDFMDEDGEQRYRVIGMTSTLLLLVAFVDRSSETEVVIRLISARKADAYESDKYTAES